MDNNRGYKIIPDKKLSVDTLLNSNKVLFTESEVKNYKKSPWTWETISGERGNRNIDFFIDAGYNAYIHIITLDNTLKNAIKAKESEFGDLTIDNLTLDDLDIDGKIKHINFLSTRLGLSHVKSHTYEPKACDILFSLKMKGWEIVNQCYGLIRASDLGKNREIAFTSRSPSKEDIQKFGRLTELIDVCDADQVFIKGSFIDYIESHRTSRIPSDIDMPQIIRDFNREKYLKMIRKKESLENITISPLLIPASSKDGYTFFDLDINETARFIYSRITNIFPENNDFLYLNKHPENIIMMSGNYGINKDRRMLVDSEKINAYHNNINKERKLHSAIRQPEMFYKHLKANNLGHLVTEPVARSELYNKDLSVKEVQILLAEASIELSQMNSKLHKYIDDMN